MNHTDDHLNGVYIAHLYDEVYGYYASTYSADLKRIILFRNKRILPVTNIGYFGVLNAVVKNFFGNKVIIESAMEHDYCTIICMSDCYLGQGFLFLSSRRVYINDGRRVGFNMITDNAKYINFPRVTSIFYKGMLTNKEELYMMRNGYHKEDVYKILLDLNDEI